MSVSQSTIKPHGGGICLYLNQEIRAWLKWNKGDRIALRPAGEKVIMERIPMDEFARIRTGAPVPRPDDAANESKP